MLCDAHVVKMSLEYGQMLSTVEHLLGDPSRRPKYRPTHQQHPCVKWLMEDVCNWQWLHVHACETWNEYTFRYGKVHATAQMFAQFWNSMSATPNGLPTKRVVPSAPPLCMPEQYHDAWRHLEPISSAPSSWDKAVCAYRAYYIHEKSRFAKWTHGREPSAWYRIPQWLTPIRNDEVVTLPVVLPVQGEQRANLPKWFSRIKKIRP
jgi:hypothetical protein